MSEARALNPAKLPCNVHWDLAAVAEFDRLFALGMSAKAIAFRLPRVPVIEVEKRFAAKASA